MKTLTLLFFIVLTFFACKEADENDRHPCFDESLVHNNPCTADCPGITGCDDQFYCNECEAARVGIRPK